MRKLFVVMIVLMAAVIYSPMVFGQENPLSYSKVVQAEGLSADEIFSRARAWVATTFNSSNDVTQLAENNMIVLKAMQQFDYKLNGLTGSDNRVNYTFTVECRDGRYRVSISNMYLTSRITTAVYNPDIQPMDFGVLTEAPANTRPAGMSTNSTKKQCEKIWIAAKMYMETFVLNMVDSLSAAVDSATTEEDW